MWSSNHVARERRLKCEQHIIRSRNPEKFVNRPARGVQQRFKGLFGVMDVASSPTRSKAPAWERLSSKLQLRRLTVIDSGIHRASPLPPNAVGIFANNEGIATISEGAVCRSIVGLARETGASQDMRSQAPGPVDLGLGSPVSCVIPLSPASVGAQRERG